VVAHLEPVPPIRNFHTNLALARARGPTPSSTASDASGLNLSTVPCGDVTLRGAYFARLAPSGAGLLNCAADQRDHFMHALDYDVAYPSARSPVFGRDAIATSHPLASQAGMAMLMRGGNAVDSAVAAAMALTVEEPTGYGIGSETPPPPLHGGVGPNRHRRSLREFRAPISSV
jgi:hypothetical protein